MTTPALLNVALRLWVRRLFMNRRNAMATTVRNFLAMCVLLLCAGSIALAQAGRGSISGLVSDPAGALIPRSQGGPAEPRNRSDAAHRHQRRGTLQLPLPQSRRLSKSPPARRDLRALPRKKSRLASIRSPRSISLCKSAPPPRPSPSPRESSWSRPATLPSARSSRPRRLTACRWWPATFSILSS